MENQKKYYLLQNIIFPQQDNWDKASLFIRPTSSLHCAFNSMFKLSLKKDDSEIAFEQS